MITPSATVRHRPARVHCGRSRTVADPGGRWQALLEIVRLAADEDLPSTRWTAASAMFQA
jgi:hypothetical protein